MIIETINLTKRYGKLVALNNLHLNIEAGECFGYIGPNGAGKTTTIRILATLLQPTWGEARVCGHVVGYESRRIRPLIGYVPDFFGAYEDMVVQEYLEFFAAAYDITGRKRTQIVGDVRELTDLSYKRDALVDSLSRGMKQRLSIARVLLHDPQVLLLDEPASGLDPRARLGTTVHVITPDDQERARLVLEQLPGVQACEIQNGAVVLELAAETTDFSFIAQAMLGGGLRIHEIKQEDVNLETAFMRLTKGIVQ